MKKYIGKIKNFWKKNSDLVFGTLIAIVIIVSFFSLLFILVTLFPSENSPNQENIKTYQEEELVEEKTFDQILDDVFLEFNKIEVK